MRCFLSEDGLSGVAIKPDGDIVSVFSNPNVKIQWDATTPEGRLFKQRYLEKHPELKEKVQGISTQDELDSQLKNEYNTSKNGGIDEERNQSGFSERDRSSLGEDTLSNDSVKTESDSSQKGKRISNTEGNISESNSGTNKRRNVTNTDISTNTGVEPQQLKIDFNTKAITEAATTDDVVNGVVNGEIKLDSKEAVDTFINKTITSDIEISGNNWRAAANDADSYLAQRLSGEYGDIDSIQTAFNNGDVKTVETIARKMLAVGKITGELVDRLNLLKNNGIRLKKYKNRKVKLKEMF